MDQYVLQVLRHLLPQLFCGIIPDFRWNSNYEENVFFNRIHRLRNHDDAIEAWGGIIIAVLQINKAKYRRLHEQKPMQRRDLLQLIITDINYIVDKNSDSSAYPKEYARHFITTVTDSASIWACALIYSTIEHLEMHVRATDILDTDAIELSDVLKNKRLIHNALTGKIPRSNSSEVPAPIATLDAMSQMFTHGGRHIDTVVESKEAASVLLDVTSKMHPSSDAANAELIAKIADVFFETLYAKLGLSG